ncbi:hypothetical protein LTR35_007794 [Friedmanniomyces endolithicus]|nr:hypothetical protein LTR35_007794 [Friedmanniomyces endolithicus]
MERIEGTKKWDASAYWKEQDFQTSARHVLEYFTSSTGSSPISSAICCIPRSPSERSPLLSNLLKMLKPGGYLQWAENDASTLTARAPEGTGMNAMTSVASIQNFFSRHQGKMDPGWLHNLGSTLEQHGCEVLADDVIVPLPELSRAWSDNLLMVWMGLPGRLPEQAIPLPQVPGLPASLSRQSLGDLIMQSTAEASQGAWAAMDQRVVVARKAG